MHFSNEGVKMELYASEWFISLFTYTLSIEDAGRVWDLFILRVGAGKLGTEGPLPRSPSDNTSATGLEADLPCGSGRAGECGSIPNGDGI